MRNEPWVWPEVGDAGTSGAGAVPLRSAQLMEQQKKKKKKKRIIVRRTVQSMFGEQTFAQLRTGFTDLRGARARARVCVCVCDLINLM